MTESIYSFKATGINGIEHAMEEYKGKVILVVNTASKCGFTSQLKGLEKLYQKYKDQGLVILGFPCNQFANQDPASNEEISEFCEMNYGVTFPMFEKINVNGRNAHPLYKFMRKKARGLAGTTTIKWNFTKFLVNREGKVIGRYPAKVTPKELEKKIQKYL